jgi:hypothetical protein
MLVAITPAGVEKRAHLAADAAVVCAGAARPYKLSR